MRIIGFGNKNFAFFEDQKKKIGFLLKAAYINKENCL
jgi:hypothetical protein